MPLREGTGEDWQRLIADVGRGLVVPVIGSELLRLRLGDAETSLEEHLARRLADTLGVAPGPTVDAVARRYVAKGAADEHTLYESVFAILKELEQQGVAPPGSLLQLASIDQFKLFVTTTFDGFLEQALRTARARRAPGAVESFAFSLRDPEDIPLIKQRKDPVVYYLFGRASTLSSYYAVTDEDVVEFMHSLPEKAEQLPNLFATLKLKHLLVLGCNYSDWLARFFFRLVKNERLFASSLRVVTDDSVMKNPGLRDFLGTFSKEFIVFPQGPRELVDRLYGDWTAKNPVPRGKVFLSYAREDRERVGVIQAALEQAGLSAWVDTGSLRGGDKWRDEIALAIRECSVFVPIVSRNTNDAEGYVWLEWRRAVEGASTPIIPLAIDDTPLPAFFREEEHTLKDPEERGRFVQRVKELVDPAQQLQRQLVS